MVGSTYIAICLTSGLAAAIIGRIKGSVAWIWFLIGAVLPLLGVIAAVAYRYESAIPDVPCPRCGRPCKIHDAVCMKCGCELEPGRARAPASPPAGG